MKIHSVPFRGAVHARESFGGGGARARRALRRSEARQAALQQVAARRRKGVPGVYRARRACASYAVEAELQAAWLLDSGANVVVVPVEDPMILRTLVGGSVSGRGYVVLV